MPVSAFCPAHLTAFFKIYKNSSAGAGVTLSLGMRTTVSKSTAAKTSILLNGKPSSAPVSKWVLSKYSRHLPCSVAIAHKSDVPVGCGFGMSAAGALSLSLALNEFCGNPYSKNSAIKIAHDADVACGTGLASVDVQSIGGLVSRKGGRGTPDVLRLSKSALSTPINLAVFGPMRTSSVIHSSDWKAKVNRAGTSALEKFYSSRTLKNMAACSNAFALGSGLGNFAGAFLRSNQSVGMVMLGKTLFSVSGRINKSDPLLRHLPPPLTFKASPTNAPASIVL